MSMWKKIKQLFIPQSDDSETEDSELEYVTFQTKVPIDVLFTKNFVAGGGLFFYCENEQETLENLKDIILNEQVAEAICFDPTLKSLLNRLNIKNTETVSPTADFAFIECEYLVALDGSIMLSSHQTKGVKQMDLPNNIIIFANPSQLVTNINEAMQRLNSKKAGNIPSQITSIRGRNPHIIEGNSSSKNLYLLLVEQF